MLKKLILSCLLFCFTAPILGDITEETNDFRISTSITKRATYLISDLYDKFQRGASIGDLGNIQIKNISNDSKRVIVRVKVWSSYVGTPDSPIVDASTNPAIRSIVIKPGQNIPFYSKTETKMMTRAVNMNPQDIINTIKSRFSASVLMSGLPPSGVIYYEISLYDESDSSLSSPLITALDAIEIVMENGNISISSPQNEESIISNFVTMVWNKLQVPSHVDVTYSIYFSKQPNFTPNDAFHKVTVQNRNTYNLNTNDFLDQDKQGKIYWRIFATDNTGMPIGTEGKSEIYSFTLQQTGAPSSNDQNLTLPNEFVLQDPRLEIRESSISDVLKEKGISLDEYSYDIFVNNKQITMQEYLELLNNDGNAEMLKQIQVSEGDSHVY